MQTISHYAPGSTTPKPLISQQTYTYNPTGQITQWTQTSGALPSLGLPASARSFSLGYDAVGQLTSADRDSGAEIQSNQYDSTGNRTAWQRQGTAVSPNTGVQIGTISVTKATHVANILLYHF